MAKLHAPHTLRMICALHSWTQFGMCEAVSDRQKMDAVQQVASLTCNSWQRMAAPQDAYFRLNVRHPKTRQQDAVDADVH
mmetsp:Transcript_12441/g.20863  ORF Transcript_12441/g.20863 Transcript_12441/m.20863 type:complete len:80 (-) Transcript_12441:178-417(-)